VTIDTVAEKAAVSVATVSRVLNNDPHVGAKYRRRVQQAVAELGYRPNRLARGLRRQRSQSIAAVVSDIENPHFAEMVRAVEDLASAAGYRLIVDNTDESPDKQRRYLQALADERVTGLILSPTDPNAGEISMLLDLDIPVVAFDRQVSDPRADAVVADNTRATAMAVRLLIGAGHRDIALVAGRLDTQTGAERVDGYQMAMREAGLAPRIVDGDFRIVGGQEATDALLRDHTPPSALIVSNNLMTIGALRVIRDSGIKVPSQLALVAVDDPFWAEFVAPPLTTVAQPVRRMAEDAVALLLERVSGARTIPRRSVHPFELRIRSSCGTRPA
jgi:DNA-binding LacI/PurR family transcriptional regulator